MYKSKYLKKVKQKPPVAERGRKVADNTTQFTKPNASQLSRRTFEVKTSDFLGASAASCVTGSSLAYGLDAFTGTSLKGGA